MLRLNWTRLVPGDWLVRLDPRVKLAWMAWVSLMSVTINSPRGLAILFGLSMAGLLVLRLTRRGATALLAILGVIAWATVFSQALFYAQVPRTPLWTIVPPFAWGDREFSGLAVYREGMGYGLTQSLRMLAVTLTGLTMTLSTSPERFLGALSRLRVPAAVGFVSVTALRFLPLTIEEWMIARQARQMRSGRAKSCRFVDGWWSHWHEEGALLVPLLATLIRRATTLSVAATARGFDPTAHRTMYPELRFRRGEYLALAAMVVTASAALTARGLYTLYVAQLHYDPHLRRLYDAVRVWL
jgi:energy-coupling factor transport system permease protein